MWWERFDARARTQRRPVYEYGVLLGPGPWQSHFTSQRVHPLDWPSVLSCSSAKWAEAVPGGNTVDRCLTQVVCLPMPGALIQFARTGVAQRAVRRRDLPRKQSLAGAAAVVWQEREAVHCSSYDGAWPTALCPYGRDGGRFPTTTAIYTSAFARSLTSYSLTLTLSSRPPSSPRCQRHCHSFLCALGFFISSEGVF